MITAATRPDVAVMLVFAECIAKNSEGSRAAACKVRKGTVCL